MFEVLDSYKLLYLVPQGVALVGGVAVVALVMTVFAHISVRRFLVFPGWGNEFFLQDLV